MLQIRNDKLLNKKLIIYICNLDTRFLIKIKIFKIKILKTRILKAKILKAKINNF